MADFSYLSDSDNEKAVEDLLSQAMDQSVLEQVAAINCSGFTDSLLPTHLETRFRKLKSLPTAPTTTKPSCVERNSKSFCSSEFSKTPKNEKIEGRGIEEKGFEVDLDDGVVENDGFSKTPDGKKSKSYEDSWSFCSSDSPNTPKIKKIDDDNEKIEGNPVKEKGSEVNSIENDVLSKIPDGKRGKKSNSWKDSVSPPVKTGCFWCSPKKGLSKKGKENRGVSMGMKWGKYDDDDLLSDLSTFSSKNQEKLMKKAMEEQEKINREAEKIVKWAKQASARMDVSSIEDELSDDDDTFK